MHNYPYIFDAIRTPRGRGKKSGALYEVKPIDLLTNLLKTLQKRNSLDTTQVEDVIIGCVTPTGEQGGNIARGAVLYADWDTSIAGMQLNRFCASGLEAINIAAMKIRSGWEDLIVAGGVESMSRVPMSVDGGALLFDPAVNAHVGFIPQGVSADLIATIEGYTREMLDTYALQSQQRAGIAMANGYFDNSIIPVHDKSGLLILGQDEHPRVDSTMEGLAALSPSFADIGAIGFDAIAIQKYPFVGRIQHLHTAGNSSGIVDGASLALIGSEEKGKALGLKPRAKILSIAGIGSEPTIMLQGAAPAAKKALAKAGMTIKDIDLWEMNEAFAAPILKFQQDLNISNDILNVNGGAIAYGHPLGATGAMLLNMMLDELERRDLSVGLITLCVGGGMGISTIIERK